MKTPHINGLKVVAARQLPKKSPLDMSTAQLIAACKKSTRELEEMAIDAEAESIKQALQARNDFLTNHPDFINPHEFN